MLGNLADWLAGTGLSQTVANILWLIPALQSVHIIAMGLLLMSAMVISLRLMNVIGRDHTINWFYDRFLSWVWWPLVVLVVTGLLLVSGEPARALLNLVFQAKMILLLAVVVLTAVTQRSVAVHGAVWSEAPSAKAKLFGLLMLLVWVAIVIAGRLIAYVE